MNKEQYEALYQKALWLQEVVNTDCGSFVQELAGDLVAMLMNIKPEDEENDNEESDVS